ncbi:lytic murein transglycosylase [Sphingomonas bacterium]|uniref:lytic murein transglycosylase n=1 Tax=Sphingomonas bacterium TaxID=1895847 RepID=UPI001576D126|nr:lytic murein transglycosylase [Sphingomonas bacterium]
MWEAWSNNILRWAGRALACPLAFVAVLPAGAQDGAGDREAGFHSFLDGLRPRAAVMGVRRATLDAVLPTLTFNPRVIDLDRAQPGADPNAAPPRFAPYYRAHVDAARIARGRSTYAANRPRLARIEAETGVPESIMVSIWGNETDYGGYTGSFDLLRSLSSLAYDGRRRELFAGEFLAALKMVDQGVPREQLKGSWAGATGNPQFLPSIYLRVARDGDGDGRADIWTSPADTLASIAGYFRDAGWRRGQPWGFAVDLPAGFDDRGVANKLVSPRCPRVFARHSGWRTMAEWRTLGVVPRAASWPGDRVQATLFQPDGPEQPAYLLTGNYRVILDYNCSNFYALSVGLLADAIVR